MDNLSSSSGLVIMILDSADIGIQEVVHRVGQLSLNHDVIFNSHSSRPSRHWPRDRLASNKLWTGMGTAHLNNSMRHLFYCRQHREVHEGGRIFRGGQVLTPEGVVFGYSDYDHTAAEDEAGREEYPRVPSVLR